MFFTDFSGFKWVTTWKNSQIKFFKQKFHQWFYSLKSTQYEMRVKLWPMFNNIFDFVTAHTHQRLRNNRLERSEAYLLILLEAKLCSKLYLNEFQQWIGWGNEWERDKHRKYVYGKTSQKVFCWRHTIFPPNSSTKTKKLYERNFIHIHLERNWEWRDFVAMIILISVNNYDLVIW
jgi:hypothetical protein